MYLTKEKKAEIFQKHSLDGHISTGLPESQIALFSYRISHLTEHLKIHKKDNVTKKSLINLVGKRKSLLNYLKNKDINRYRETIKKLNIRK